MITKVWKFRFNQRNERYTNILNIDANVYFFSESFLVIRGYSITAYLPFFFLFVSSYLNDKICIHNIKISSSSSFDESKIAWFQSFELEISSINVGQLNLLIEQLKHKTQNTTHAHLKFQRKILFFFPWNSMFIAISGAKVLWTWSKLGNDTKLKPRINKNSTTGTNSLVKVISELFFTVEIIMRLLTNVDVVFFSLRSVCA